jgi:hypothetical protein
MFPQSLTELANLKHFRVVFSDKSGKMCILPSTTFLPFGGLACFAAF